MNESGARRHLCPSPSGRGGRGEGRDHESDCTTKRYLAREPSPQPLGKCSRLCPTSCIHAVVSRRERGFRKQSGVTLIELIVAIVIIGVALVGVLLVLNRAIATSGDPMMQQQAVAIGEAYIEEIIGKAYTPQPNPAGRQNYNDVDDYKNLPDNVVRDQNGNAIASLGSYYVAVKVDDGATLNGAPAKLITVTVSHPGMQNIVLAAYRLDY